MDGSGLERFSNSQLVFKNVMSHCQEPSNRFWIWNIYIFIVEVMSAFDLILKVNFFTALYKLYYSIS